MKRFFFGLLLVLGISQSSFASDTANIKIRISGATKQNNFFLCMPDLGCLSIYNGTIKGKVYPVMRDVDMNTLFVTDFSTLEVYNQGLPVSCQVTVEKSKTITISGSLGKKGNKVKVNQLKCVVS